jgi:hypothetical protein
LLNIYARPLQFLLRHWGDASFRDGSDRLRSFHGSSPLLGL